MTDENTPIDDLPNDDLPGVDLPIIDDRFELIERLGEGGFGTVYRAKDRLKGEDVALKRIILMTKSEVDTAGISTIKDNKSTEEEEHRRHAMTEEFKVLASLHHPNIIGVLDYGFDSDNNPYFTMELIEDAVDISKYGESQSYEIQIDLMVQSLRALVYLHHHGIIHRDLKPSNVLTRNSQVKVLDFGLAVQEERLKNVSADDDNVVSGTLPYMSPEVILTGRASKASDLFAIGVISYEIFTGIHPFGLGTESISHILERILRSDPDMDILEIDDTAKKVLEKLLTKDTQDRYSDAEKVIQALGHDPLTPTTIQALVQAAPFVGREKELAKLLDILAAAIGGSGSGWLLGGESGIGKSRLLSEIRTHAVVKGVLVLRGQGVKGGGLRFQLWREAVRHLLLTIVTTDDQAGVLKSLIEDIETLLHREIPDPPELDGKEGQDRLIQTIVEIFHQIKRPTLLILEDLQWADESIEVLKALTQIIKDIPLMVVASYRKDERPTLAQELPDMQELIIQKLSPNDISELSAALLGPAGRLPEVLELLMHHTGGNTFFVVEIARALVEQAGRLSRVGSATVRGQLLTKGLPEIFRRRLLRIPVEGHRLLRLAAVYGQKLDLQLLAVLEPTLNIDQWLLECSEAGMLVIESGEWSFAHDKVRQGILELLSQEEQKPLYRAVIDGIQQIHPTGEGHLVTLALLCETVGDTVNAARWYRSAAQEAEAGYALGSAITYYDKATHFLPEDAIEQRLDAYYHLGKMLRWQTRFEEAGEDYNAMLKLAESANDKVAQARAWIGLGDMESSRGNLILALQDTTRAIQLAREVDAQAELADALIDQGFYLFRQGNMDSAIPLNQEALEISTRQNYRSLLARAHSNLGMIHAVSGRFKEAFQPMQEALIIARELGSQQDIGLKLNNLGEVARLSGDNIIAADLFEESLSIFQRVGDKNAEMATLTNLGAVYIDLKNHNEAEAYLRRVIDLFNQQRWSWISETYRLLAETCFYQNKVDEALSFGLQALTEGQAVDIGEFIGKAWRILGRVADRQNKPILYKETSYDAPALFEEALKIFTEGPERLSTLQAFAAYTTRIGNLDHSKQLENEINSLLQ